MRVIARNLLILLVLTLTAGPLMAAPVSLRTGPTVTAHHTATSPTGALVAILGSGIAIFGAIRVKDVGSLAKKFVTRAGAASGEYASGVQGAGSDWEANTRASEENYKAGVTQAAADGRFGKGVAAAGAQKYQTRSSTLGAQRYPGGVAAAEGEWGKNTAPYLQTIAGLTLPPRRPKGDPGNQQRANVVAAALRAQKLGR